MLNAIAGYPRAAAFRLQNHFAIKLLDFGHYLKAKRLVSLDSDVLFFDRPDAVIRCLEDPGRPINYANGDLDSSYTVSSGDARRLAGVELVGRLNAGFGLFHRDSLRLDWIEEFLALPGILGHWWRIEQTLYALCSSRFGCELLPPEYDVFTDGAAWRPALSALRRGGASLNVYRRDAEALCGRIPPVSVQMLLPANAPPARRSATATSQHRRRVVHLPVYRDNPYQPMLMDAQRELRMGGDRRGGGGNFLRTAWRDWRADVMHFHWLHPYLLRPGVAASWGRGMRFLAEVTLLKSRGSRIVWTVHNLSNHEGLHPRIELALTRRFVRLCDAVVVHGLAAAGAAQERFRVPASVPVVDIPHPHYADRLPRRFRRTKPAAGWGSRTRGGCSCIWAGCDRTSAWTNFSPPSPPCPT